MKKIRLSKMDKCIYYEKLSNGLEVYMYPTDKTQSFYLTYNFKFGSMDTNLKVEGQKRNIIFPQGTAHFLEHQLFQNDKESAFYEFSKLGSSVNAYTSYDITCYEVISNTNFKENLETLIKFVNTPVFTEDSIKNERKIIANEINMYEDIPDAQSTFGLEYNLNINDAHKYNISGTTSDIEKIDDKTLYKAYDLFYAHENSFLVLTGSFSCLEALGIIKEKMKLYPKGTYKKITRVKKREPLKVFKRKETKTMSVSTPKISVAYKIDKKEFKNIDPFVLNTYLNAILDLKYSTSSDFYEDVTSSHVIEGDIVYSIEIRDDYIKASFKYNSEYIDESLELIKETFLAKNITEADLERIKKVYISSYIRSFDDIITTQEMISKDVMDSQKINTGVVDTYTKLTFPSLEEIENKLKICDETLYIIEAK